MERGEGEDGKKKKVITAMRPIRLGGGRRGTGNKTQVTSEQGKGVITEVD